MRKTTGRSTAVKVSELVFDLLVDATSDAEGVVDRFRQSFLHVRAGGTYVFSGSSQAADRLSSFLDALTAGGETEVPVGERTALMGAVADVRLPSPDRTARRRSRR